MWLQSLLAEFAITVADGAVWLSIGQGLLVGAVCLAFGKWLARYVGLLTIDAPGGETLGVGLASGLLVLASWWAAIASGGRSSFTPVAIGFAAALALAVTRRRRDGPDDADAHIPGRRFPSSALMGGAVFVIAVALLYGSTMALSARDGVQPLEFNDEAYYSVLGADLARTGNESAYSPSGFDEIPGLPLQTWYHWGELWIGSAVITVFGISPLAARHFVVLPLLLLAAATLTGTLVRRITGATARSAFFFGFLACLFLAPVPLIQGPLLGALSVGLIFGITAYGLAAVAVLFALYSLTVFDRQTSPWSVIVFIGTAAAVTVPAHLIVALLGIIGIGSVSIIRVGQSIATTGRLPAVSPVWRRTFLATAVVIAATIIWGFLTGHGIADSGTSPNVSSFGAFWLNAVVVTALGAGAFLSILVAWFVIRADRSIEVDLYLGTSALLVIGAIVWGARLPDLLATHMFVAGIAVFATPAAAVAVWSIWRRLRATGHMRLAVAVLVLCGAQMEFGLAMGIVRLQSFGPPGYEPVPEEILAAIRTLPPDAKLAYACLPSEEVAFWEARLIGLDAHTGRRVVPMCFQAEVTGSMTGTPISPDVPGPLFERAPQHALYPDSKADVTATRVAAFLKDHGINFIYSDGLHPNSMVPGAGTVAASGDTSVLRIP